VFQPQPRRGPDACSSATLGIRSVPASVRGCPQIRGGQGHGGGPADADRRVPVPPGGLEAGRFSRMPYESVSPPVGDVAKRCAMTTADICSCYFPR
jgi:hypothetical protein